MNIEKNRFLGEIFGSRLMHPEDIYNRSLERGFREVRGHCFGIPETQAIETRERFLSSLPADFRKWTREKQIEHIASYAYDQGRTLASFGRLAEAA
jgi:hypothetical protein